MIRKNANQWLAVVVTLPLLTALVGLPAAAWGPYSQAVIAERAADALGTPKGTAGPDFINSTVVAKAFEFSDRTYAKQDPVFAHTMKKIGGAGPALPHVLGWGSTQAADRSGDEVMFYKAQHPYDRWLLELMVDASLMNAIGESGGGNILETLGVSCRPALLAATSKHYCHGRSPAAPFSAQYALQRAELQALAMIAERVIIADENFQANADTIVPASDCVYAVNYSVNAVIDYVASGILEEPAPAGGVGADVEDYPIELLSKLGSVLTAGGDASFSFTSVDGAVRYKIDVVSKRSNKIARSFLNNVAEDETECPGMRRLAGMLIDAMSPGFGPRSYVDN